MDVFEVQIAVAIANTPLVNAICEKRRVAPEEAIRVEPDRVESRT